MIALLVALIATGIGPQPCPRSTGICPPTSDGVWVATTGNDSNKGTRSSPWLTVGHAVSYLRSAGKATGTINVRAGNYYNTSLSLTAADHALKIKSYDGNGAAHLVGGYKIDTSTCTIVSGSIYQCPIGNSDDPHALFEDGVPLELARVPNSVHDSQYPAALGPFFRATDSGGNYHTTMGYLSSDVNLAGITPSDVVVSGRSYYPGSTAGWWWELNPVTAIDTTSHIITMANHFKYNSYTSAGMYYFLAGSCAWLDQAGEWCKNTASHYVRLWPRASMATTEIVVPTSQDVIRVVGADAGHLSSGVTLQGLSIRGSDSVAAYTYGAWGKDIPFPPGTPGGPDWDSTQWAGHTLPLHAIDATVSTYQHGLVFAQYTTGLTVSSCHVYSGGLGGVFLYGSNVSAAITDNWINQVGYSGIQAEGGWTAEGDINHGHTISRNKIEMTGRIIGHGRCIDLLASGSNTIDRNECGGTPREGLVSLGTCDSATASDCYTQNNHTTRAWVHDTVNSSDDSGAVYESVTQNLGPATVVNYFDQVLVDRVAAAPSGSNTATPVAGLYLDELANAQNVSNFNVTNYHNANWFNSSGHTLTNVSWGTFNDALMDYANIGISQFTHPYAVASAQTFSDNFESGLGSWVTAGGSPALDTAHSHSATHAFKPADGTQIYHALEGAQRSIATVWFYDDATSLTAQNIARADDSSYRSTAYFIDQTAITVAWRALGVDTATSTTNYIAIYGNAEHVLSTVRATGWHAFSFDFRDGANVIMAIDGTTVATASGTHAYNGIVLGDPFTDGRSGPGWFDDVAVIH